MLSTLENIKLLQRKSIPALEKQNEEMMWEKWEEIFISEYVI